MTPWHPRRVLFAVLTASALAAMLAWGFAAHFRPDLLIGFATWVRSCF
ncbi:MAG: hypothetical protein U1E63_07625 [Burkholderiales bacterium]